MNLVYASCGCVESGNELADESRFRWYACGKDAEVSFHDLVKRCRDHIDIQVDIIKANEPAMIFQAPYCYLVAWLRIPDDQLPSDGNPFDALPDIAAGDADPMDALRGWIVRYDAVSVPSRGKEAIGESDVLGALEELFI